MRRRELTDDRELMMSPARGGVELMYVVKQMGCYASALVVAIAWVGTAGVIAWQGWRLALWPFLAMPAAGWVCLLALPMFFRMQRVIMTVLDAMVATAEAYLARAGWSVDLNNDGAIGHRQPEILPAVEEKRPLLVRGRVSEEPRVPLPAPVGDEAQRAVGSGDVPGMEPEREQLRIKMWRLPNGERIREDRLCEFVDGIFTKGHNREAWPHGAWRESVCATCRPFS